MRVVLAKHIGFCSGVRRAVKIVEDLLINNKKENIFCFGAVIHNQQVLEKLRKQGLKEVSSLKTIKSPAYLVLPSHGTSR
ncbi:MAG: 4-hydroxy-3-methylbut-2-enyl diphosphate reductase, partial [Candidatus Omnitrophica bacterium]|nr:4-hydroxy-3-methylbut-2-enyl diphosphate reductase [Candidatus Omnitrophota bacterium]